MTRSGCLLCAGYGNRHDPIAHDAEPTPDVWERVWVMETEEELDEIDATRAAEDDE